MKICPPPLIKMKMKESQLVKACADYLTMRNILWWRNNTGILMKEYKGRSYPVRFGLKGSGDILAILPPYGKFLSIECKVNDNVQSEAQKEFEKQVRNAGGGYIIVRDVIDLIDYFNSFGD